MTNYISSLLNTSVADATISLNHDVDKDPQKAIKIADEVIRVAKGQGGHKSLITVAERVRRKAEKRLKE